MGTAFSQNQIEAIISHRRALHRIPEIGLELPRTSAYVEKALLELGLTPKKVGSGMWADVGTQGPRVAIRADMDGLPVAEETGLPYASEHNGLMHACGHDGHTAALLGVASRLTDLEKQGTLTFRARLIFQAGEEGYFGALPLLEAGVLEGVKAITGGHLGTLSDQLHPGQAAFLAGPLMAASDRFEGAFVGQGGHGSAPQYCLDPISAFAEFAAALNILRSRELDQTRPSVVSLCAVHAGSTHNVIPERADFMGTARSLHADIRKRLETRIGELGQGIAQMRGLRFDYNWISGYPPLVNTALETQAAFQAAIGALGKQRVTVLERPIMGSEDFAYYLEKVPGCFWFLDTRAPERGIRYPNHNPRFDMDEALLGDFAAVQLSVAEALAEIHR